MSENHEPCELVVALNTVVMNRESSFGELRADIGHIKKKIDNGLFQDVYARLDSIKDSLNQINIDSVRRNGNLVAREKDKDSEDWFLRIFSGSAKKVVGWLITFMILSALITAATNNALWTYLKISYLKESPGQQQQILNSLENGYHSHVQKDGRILWHAGTKDKPAWLINPLTNIPEACPELRTESVK
jgi:hypothetical protein